ncbi:MAG: hypothetical protein WBK97_04930 [Bacteroidales bacterium]|jgi:hypothetical protein
MTFLSFHNMEPVWQWLKDFWQEIFGDFAWAEPIYDFLVSFLNIFRDLFYFTF